MRPMMLEMLSNRECSPSALMAIDPVKSPQPPLRRAAAALTANIIINIRRTAS